MRKFVSLLSIWSFVFFTMPTFADTRIQDDLITIGKPGSSSSKSLKFKGTSQELRANTSINKIEYSNDGITYKPIGSGSGSGGSSGINLLSNDSFEDPITTGWTNTGGTFTQETYANGIDGDVKYAKLIASAGGQYFESVAVVIPSNFSGGCQVDFKKVNVSANDLFKVEAIDGSANILATANVKLSSWVKFPTLSFQCPTSPTTVKVRVTSISAGTIEVDKGYVGSNQNIINISQAKYFGSLKYVSTAGCNWTTVSTSFVGFSADADCPTPIALGGVGAPATKIPAFVLPANSPAGTYYIEARSDFYKTGSADGGVRFMFNDGTSNFGYGVSYAAAAYSTTPSISGTISYASSGTAKTIQILGRTDSASNTANVYAINPTGLEFDIYYYPSQSEQAVNTDQASWFIDANIGGGNIATDLSSSYIEYASTSLDLVLNQGTANAQIACVSGTDSTGLTCTSNESVGITFTNPMAGTYEACFDFTQEMSNGVTTNQIVETAPASSVIVQEGKTRISSSGGASITYVPYSVCGTFNFSDSKRRTIRLMYEATIASGSQLLLDRNAANGQRDLHITIKNTSFGQNRPILTGDQVTSPLTTKLKIFNIKTNSAGVVSQDIGDLINGNASVTDTSLFTYSLNLKFTTWNTCFLKTNEIETTNGIYQNVQTQTLNSLIIRTGYLTSGLVKAPYSHEILCIGE